MNHFLSALALVLVLEGLMPFAAPERWKAMMRKMLNQDEKAIRVLGFFCMLIGVILLNLIHQFAD